MKLKRFEIDVCEGRLKLDGEMCNTPGCIFIRNTTEEIRERLHEMNIMFENEVIQEPVIDDPKDD